MDVLLLCPGGGAGFRSRGASEATGTVIPDGANQRFRDFQNAKIQTGIFL